MKSERGSGQVELYSGGMLSVSLGSKRAGEAQGVFQVVWCGLAKLELFRGFLENCAESSNKIKPRSLPVPG